MAKVIIILTIISFISLFCSVKGIKDLYTGRGAEHKYLKTVIPTAKFDKEKNVFLVVRADEFCHTGDDINYEKICRGCLSHQFFVQKKIRYDDSKGVEHFGGCTTKSLDVRDTCINHIPISFTTKHIANQQVLLCPIYTEGSTEAADNHVRNFGFSNGPFTDDKKLSCFVYTDTQYEFPNVKNNTVPQKTSGQKDEKNKVHQSNTTKTSYEKDKMSLKLLVTVDVENIKNILGNQALPVKKEINKTNFTDKIYKLYHKNKTDKLGGDKKTKKPSP